MSNYGGKPYPDWVHTNPKYPGYKNAYIEFEHVKTRATKKCGFLVSPSSFGDQRSNSAQANKTTAGWIIYRTGKNLGAISFGGILLDTAYTPERLQFLKRFATYGEDGYNDKFETKNEYLQHVYIEGIKYSGYIQSFSLNKNAQNPYIYQYSISFVVYGETIQHQTSGNGAMSEKSMDILAGVDASSVPYVAPKIGRSMTLAPGLYDILK